VADGKLECYRIGVGRGTLRFDEAQLNHFLEESRSTGLPSDEDLDSLP
jgi:hypothetical protein